MPPLCGFAARWNDFTNGIHRADDDRAERARGLVIETLPAHRQAEETGRAEGFAGRIHFFEVASGAFLAVIHAEDELRFGLACERGHATVVGGQRSEDLLPVVAFIGQQPDLAAFASLSEVAQASSACAPSAVNSCSSCALMPSRWRKDEQRPGDERCSPRCDGGFDACMAAASLRPAEAAAVHRRQ
ncbi:MAG: hypothetical protein V5B36_06650 [Candidatus Accumulibacter sp. UW25]